jgi:hypothetical protein
MPVILLACVLGHDSEAVRLKFCHGRWPRHSLDLQRTDSIQKDGSLDGDSGVRGGGSRDRGDVCARTTSLRGMGKVDLVGDDYLHLFCFMQPFSITYTL